MVLWGLLKSIIVGVLFLIIFIGIVFYIAFLFEFIFTLIGLNEFAKVLRQRRKDLNNRLKKSLNILKK